MGEGILVEDVPELAIETLVVAVIDLQNSILDTKRVANVVVEIVARELDLPVLQILAVEEGNPGTLCRGIILLERGIIRL